MAEKYDFFKIRSDVKKIKDNGGTIDAVKLYLSRNGMTLDEFVTRNKSLGRKSLSNIARTGIGQGLMFGFGDEATAGIKALFGADYDKTLMAWFHNFEQHWPQLKANYDERFYRMWQYYLLSCAGGFRSRDIELWQLVLSKQGVLGGYQSIR